MFCVREQDADAERARLFHQRQQRRLRRRIGHRRKIAGDLVHVDDRAQARRPGLRPHPGHHLIEQERDDEHAFGVAEMGDGHDRDAWLSGSAVEERRRVERLSLQPLLETRARPSGCSAASPARSGPWPDRTIRGR